MRENVIVLAAQYIDQLGYIRAIPQWKAARHEGNIWLKGPLDNGKKQVLIRSLPILESYQLDEENRLFPNGSLTPTAFLAEMDWQELPAFLPVSLPVSALPAPIEGKVVVYLQRTEKPQPSAALAISFETWKWYATTAPLMRLAQLKFAVSAQRQVIIIGLPLPALPGKSYWLNGKLLIPAGFDFNWPFIGDLLNQRFQASEPGFILFNEQGEQTTIASNCFKKADRAAIRQIVF